MVIRSLYVLLLLKVEVRIRAENIDRSFSILSKKIAISAYTIPLQDSMADLSMSTILPNTSWVTGLICPSPMKPRHHTTLLNNQYADLIRYVFISWVSLTVLRFYIFACCIHLDGYLCYYRRPIMYTPFILLSLSYVSLKSWNTTFTFFAFSYFTCVFFLYQKLITISFFPSLKFFSCPKS